MSRSAGQPFGVRLRRQFLLLAAVPVLAVAGAAWALLTPVLLQQAELRNRELALAMRGQIALRLELRVQAASALAERLRDAGSNPTSRAQWLQTTVAADPFLQAAMILDERSRVVDAALSPGGGRFVEDTIGLDLSGRTYVAQARRQGTPVWSDTYLSTMTEQVTAALAVPAGEQMVVLELALAGLSASISELAQAGNAEVVIVDRAGRIIVHPESRRALEQQSLSALAPVRSALAGRSAGGRIVTDGVERVADAVPIAPVGWAVLVSEPLRSVTAPLRRLGGAAAGVLALTLLLAVAAGRAMARRTAGEVAQLVAGAETAAQSGVDPPALKFSIAEFNALWRRLGELFGQLHLRDAQTLAAQQDLQAVLDAATQVAVVATDVDGRVTMFNVGAQRLLGYRADEVVGRLTPLAWHATAEVEARAQQLGRQLGRAVQGVETLFAGTRHSGYEVRDWRFLRRDGTALDASQAVTAMRTPEGAVKGFLLVAVDITERRRAAELEVARRAAEGSSRAKSEFLSQMSHELRTPLNAILGYAQLLEADATQPPSARQREELHQIQRAGWHLVRLIDDVLDLSRIESGRLAVHIAPVPLRPLLAQAATMVAPQLDRHAVTLRVELDEAHGSLHVAADETRLLQVLVNLLGNAAKYNRPQGEVRLGCRAEGAQVRLSVSDDGPGMTPAQLAHLYEPFNRLGRERSGVEGTGIGLVVTRHLVQLMHGELDVHSEPGVGTTFVVTLPLARDAAASPAPAPGAPAEGPAARGRILYLEDNEVNAVLMRAILRQRPGVDLRVCVDAASGLAAARAQPPDLILLDMHLPDALGEDVIAALRADERLRGVPVVVVSADATRAHVEATLRAGVRAYLTKPLDVRETLRTLDEVLGRPAAVHA